MCGPKGTTMYNDLYQFLLTNFPVLNEYEAKHRNFIINMIYKCYCGRRNHNIYSKSDMVFSFKASYLRKLNFRNWEKLIAPFFLVINPLFIPKEFTRAFTFTDELLKVLDEFDIGEIKAKDVSKNNEIIINVDNGIRALKFIQHLISKKDFQTYNKVFEPKNDIQSISELKMKKYKLISLLFNSTQIKYKEGNTGRLYQQSDCNLQACPSELRKVLLSGLGYYDYDIENCHYSILYQLLLKNNIDANLFPVFKKYIEFKRDFREKLSKEFEIDLTTTKDILSALVNSGATNYKSRCFTGLKYEHIKDKILSNDTFVSLKKELKIIRMIIQQLYVKGDEVVNEIGKILELKIKTEGKKRNLQKSKIMSHILHGYERLILDTVCNKYNDLLVLKIHDGWILRKNIQRKDIIDEIKIKTGLNVSLSKDPLDKIINSLVINH